MTHCKQTHQEKEKKKRKKTLDVPHNQLIESSTEVGQAGQMQGLYPCFLGSVLGVSKVCEHFIVMGQIFEKVNKTLIVPRTN
jgi:hypothetical protein